MCESRVLDLQIFLVYFALSKHHSTFSEIVMYLVNIDIDVKMLIYAFNEL